MASIHIGTGFDLEGFKAGYAKIEKGVQSIARSAGSAIKSISAAFNPKPIQETSAAIMRQQAIVDELKAKLQAISDIEASAPAIKKLQLDIRLAEEYARSFDSTIEKLRAVISDDWYPADFQERGRAELERVVEKAALAAERVDELKGKLSEIEMPEQPKETMEQLNAKLAISEQKLEEMNSTSNKTSSSIKGALLSIGTMAQNAMKKAGSAIKNIFSKSIAGATKNTHGLASGIERTINRIKQLLISVVIFNVLRKLFKEFRDYVSLALKSNQDFANSFAQVRGNLATAFQPIMQSIIPILATLMQWLATVTAYLAAFISMLFGKTVKASQAAAKSMDDLASSTAGAGGASKAANKEAQKMLATFDDINQLAQETAETDAGGGGGAAAIEPIYPEIPELDPEEWLGSFGEKLAIGINKIMDSIDWTKIQDTARRIAETITTNLNDFIETLNWYNLGNTIAQGINTAIQFAYTFVTTFKWKEFGDSIGDSINGFFENIEWDTLGETVGTAIIGVFNTLGAMLDKVDWKAIGEDVATFVKNIDWKGIWESILAFIGSAFTGFKDFLAGVFGSEAAADIIVRILGAIAIAVGVLSTALGIYNAVMAVAAIVTNATLWPILLIVAAIAALIAIIILVVIYWDEIIAAIKSGIHVIMDVFSNIVSWIQDKVIKPISDFFKGLIDGIKNAFNSAIEFIKGIWKTVSDWFNNSVITPIKTLFTGLWDGITNAAAAVWQGIKDGVRAMVNAVISVLNAMVAGILTPFNVIIKGLNSIPGVKIPTLSLEIPKIPAFATGTVVPPNNEFMAILGDNKREPEVVSPISTMKQAFVEAMQEMGGSFGGGDITIVAEGDTGELIRFIRFKIKEEDNRQGNRMSNRVVIV